MSVNTPLSPEALERPPQHWGAVLGTGFAVFLVSGTIGLLGGAGLVFGLASRLFGPEAISHFPENYDRLTPEVMAFLSKEGLFLCSALFMVPSAIAFLWILLRPTFREYLGLKWPGLRQGLRWGLLILAVNYATLWLTSWLPVDWSGGDAFEKIGRIPLFLPLVVLSLAVLIPIFEELLFRGFLLEGLRRSSLGETGAILLTSSLWAVAHSGGPVRWLEVFICGVLLALARLRTGSTYLTILVHCIVNLAAVLLTAFA
jgi:uncharacterized protein